MKGCPESDLINKYPLQSTKEKCANNYTLNNFCNKFSPVSQENWRGKADIPIFQSNVAADLSFTSNKSDVNIEQFDEQFDDIIDESTKINSVENSINHDIIDRNTADIISTKNTADLTIREICNNSIHNELIPQKKVKFDICKPLTKDQSYAMTNTNINNNENSSQNISIKTKSKFFRSFPEISF